jgi:hypothetical protein
MVNCMAISITLAHGLESSILVHALIFYINNVTQLNAISPCGVHMESGWVNLYFPVF